MDVPPILLPELSDEDAVREPMKVNIVIIGSSDDESVTLNVVVFNDLDGVDDGSVSNNEELLQEELVGRLIIELNFGDIPDLHLA